MAGTVLTVQTSARTGLSLTDQAVAADGVNGNRWLTSGAETLIVINGGGSPCVVTLIYGPGATFDGQAVTNRTVSVPAGKTYEIGGFPTSWYQDSSGYMNVSFNQVTSVTVVVRKTATS